MENFPVYSIMPKSYLNDDKPGPYRSCGPDVEMPLPVALGPVQGMRSVKDYTRVKNATA